jgi:hypothetical protein
MDTIYVSPDFSYLIIKEIFEIDSIPPAQRTYTRSKVMEFPSVPFNFLPRFQAEYRKAILGIHKQMVRGICREEQGEGVI